MTAIKADCSNCGDVTLNPSRIELKVCGYASMSYYSFDCPNCGSHNHKSASDSIVSILMSGGVRAEMWDVPAEALEEHVGEPLDWDDVLDFHEELNAL